MAIVGPESSPDRWEGYGRCGILYLGPDCLCLITDVRVAAPVDRHHSPHAQSPAGARLPRSAAAAVPPPPAPAQPRSAGRSGTRISPSQGCSYPAGRSTPVGARRPECTGNEIAAFLSAKPVMHGTKSSPVASRCPPTRMHDQRGCCVPQCKAGHARKQVLSCRQSVPAHQNARSTRLLCSSGQSWSCTEASSLLLPVCQTGLLPQTRCGG